MGRWRRRPNRASTQSAPRFWPAPRRRRAWPETARTLLLALVALLIWPTLDPALIEPPAFLSSEPERVDFQFSFCGRGRSHACVVDGDTIRIGERRIRLVGIDAPEIEGKCAAERALALRAKEQLRILLNQGPFTMTARIDDMTDRYGRELRVLTRRRADGSRQSIAAEMREAGLAARYLGHKANWC